MDSTQDFSISLNKYISNSGICSRREANRLIEAGRVKINNKVAKLGNRVEKTDRVSLDGKLIRYEVQRTIIALNKPRGIVCTTDPKERKNIVDFVGYKERIFPIGRLDKPSEGLIFLTNDGDVVNKILRSGNNHEKEYIVRVNKPINKNFITRMGNGIPILGTVTKKCYVAQIDKFTFKIILVEGLNRQIRRMCEFLGYEVKSLRRVRIMNIQLGNLPTGKWRVLSGREMKKLEELIADSSKTAD